MKKEYIKAGICIWCLQGKPDGKTFRNQPHTITRQLGDTNIGVDICDECNFYFGTAGKIDQYTVSPEIAFAEIVNSIYFLSKPIKDEHSYKELNSRFFGYYHSTGAVMLKKAFEDIPGFATNFTRQFKRGAYEVFLQEYHLNTGKALNTKFDRIRDFARRNTGDLPLYFLKIASNPSLEAKPARPALVFCEHSLSQLEEFGFYQMPFGRYIFFLEVTPAPTASRELYLKRVYQHLAGIKPTTGKITKLDSIADMGFSPRIITPKVKKN